jgi:hypothetical protein
MSQKKQPTDETITIELTTFAHISTAVARIRPVSASAQDQKSESHGVYPFLH